LSIPAQSPHVALFLSCARGLEPLLALELNGIGAAAVKEHNGGVACSGDWPLAYRACLWSRLASRVLLPLASFGAADAQQLYAAALAVDWPAWFSANRTFAVEVAGHAEGLPHTQFAALRVKDAIADRFREDHGRRPDVDTAAPDIPVHLHLRDAQWTCPAEACIGAATAPAAARRR
jgi:23S rRNA (guanine2445-N2)-methyltransferase / 23S rRNA (guanine2069-N7)-methyltransferase